MPIRWAMGASSAMGQTYILEKDGQLYESRMSWFRELNGLGPTLGGGNSLPADLGEAAGRLMSHDDKLSCFGCHATNAAAGKELTLDRMTPGVQCEHCHQATAAHLAAMARNSAVARRPARLDQPAKSVRRAGVQLLRPVPPYLGRNRHASEARHCQCAVPAVSSHGEQMLRPGRCAHQLSGLSRPAYGGKRETGGLRCEVPGMPCRRKSEREGLPSVKEPMRLLSYA